jgi:hypothetical protein
MTRVSRPPRSTAPWATPAGEFKIWELDHHYIRVEFSVAAEHKGEAGPMANAGDGHGIATIQGNIAIFRPDGADADCRITLKFTRHNLVVTQTNRCYFGKFAKLMARTKKSRQPNQSSVSVILETKTETRKQIHS